MGPRVNTGLKIEIILVWIGLYYVLVALYITHKLHQSLTKLTSTKIIFIAGVVLIMSHPLILVFLHTTEAMNVTTINAQTYLPAANCQLLHNLDGQHPLPANNSIFESTVYYRELPNNQGCFIYKNTIRYSFAYDFVLIVKKNIQPLRGHDGQLYNEYVRLSCFASNCYSENHLYYKINQDLNNELLIKGAKLDRPL